MKKNSCTGRSGSIYLTLSAIKSIHHQSYFRCACRRDGPDRGRSNDLFNEATELLTAKNSPGSLPDFEIFFLDI